MKMLTGENVELAYKIRNKFIELLNDGNTQLDIDLLDFMLNDVTDPNWYLERKDILKDEVGISKVCLFNDLMDLVKYRMKHDENKKICEFCHKEIIEDTYYYREFSNNIFLYLDNTCCGILPTYVTKNFIKNIEIDKR